MGIFSSKQKRREARSDLQITDTDRAVSDLKSTKMKLGKELKRLEEANKRDTEVARGLIAAKRKDRALLVLKMKRVREQQLETAEKYLLNVQQVLMNIETAQMTNKLYSVLKQGKEAVEGLQKLVTLDDVEQLMSDTAAAKEYQEQMQQALEGELGMGEDADALQELNDLEQEVIQEEMSKMPSPPVIASEEVAEEDLPQVPKHAVEPRPESKAESQKLEAPLLAA